jgi:hypothetical protein
MGCWRIAQRIMSILSNMLMAAAGVGQGLFLDTFTSANGTQLSAHTSESGHTYTNTIHYPAQYTTLEIQSNYLTQPAVPARSAHALINGLSLVAGGNRLAIDVDFTSVANYAAAGIIVNWSGSGATRYGLWAFLDTDLRLNVYKEVNGVETLLYGAISPGTLAATLRVGKNSDGTYTFEHLRGGSVQQSYTTATPASLGIGSGEGVGFGFYASNGIIPKGLKAYEVTA